MSVLYWHVADSQSFPLEVARFPELSKAAAYSEEDIYSEHNVQDIIIYAGEVRCKFWAFQKLNIGIVERYRRCTGK